TCGTIGPAWPSTPRTWGPTPSLSAIALRTSSRMPTLFSWPSDGPGTYGRTYDWRYILMKKLLALLLALTIALSLAACGGCANNGSGNKTDNTNAANDAADNEADRTPEEDQAEPPAEEPETPENEEPAPEDGVGQETGDGEDTEASGDADAPEAEGVGASHSDVTFSAAGSSFRLVPTGDTENVTAVAYTTADETIAAEIGRATSELQSRF